MRKKFLPRFAVIAVCTFILQGAGFFIQPSCADAAQPNIILIVADDMGWGDVSSINTPNIANPDEIDSLAKNGITLTNFHTPSPLCSPSRASLLTGRHPLHHGVVANKSLAVLPTSEVTLAQVLKQKFNYKTAVIGKWHLGGWDDYSNSDNQPKGKGFDRYYVLPNGIYPSKDFCVFDGWSLTSPQEAKYFVINTHISKSESNICPNYTNKNDTLFWTASEFKDKETGVHQSLTKSITGKAAEYIKTTTSPYFLYVALPAPHEPMDVHLPDGEDVQNRIYSTTHPTCADDDIKCLVNEEYKASCISKWNGADDTCYDNVLREIDAGVQQIIGAIPSTQDTIVIFTSDNGQSMGTHLQSYNNSALVQTSNKPYKGGKYVNFEGGIRIPFIAARLNNPTIKWKGIINGSGKSDQLADMTDIFKTLLAVVYDNNIPETIDIQSTSGTLIKSLNTKGDLDGVDISPVLGSGAQVDRVVHSFYPEARDYCDDNTAACSCTDNSGTLCDKMSYPYAIQMYNSKSSEHYKLFLDYDYFSREFYNLRTDFAETINITAPTPTEIEIKNRLASTATDFYINKIKYNHNQRALHFNFSGTGSGINIKPVDAADALFVRLQFFDADKNLSRYINVTLPPLTKYYFIDYNIICNDINSGAECKGKSIDTQMPMAVHTNKRALILGSTTSLDNDTHFPHHYYLPSIKDGGLGWENYITVKAKDAVNMDARINVYDKGGNLKARRIYTRSAIEAINVRPCWVYYGVDTSCVPIDNDPDDGVIDGEGSVIVETSVPAIVSTNTIANTYKGFSINEAAKPRSEHNFPKIYDGPTFYQNYLLIQNIYDTPRNVTVKLFGKTATAPGNGAERTVDIPAFGTWKVSPSDIADSINFDGSVKVYSNFKANSADGNGLPIPAMCRYEAGIDALAIYESTVVQPSLYFPALKDGKFGGSLDYQNFLSVVNPGSTDAIISIYLYNKSGVEEGKLLNEVIPAGGKNTWRPSWIKGSIPAPVDFEGSAVVITNLPVVGMTNTIYPGKNAYGVEAFDLLESAIPNSTLFFPKAFDNLLGSGIGATHLLDNYVYVQNPDNVGKNIKIEQFNNNGSNNGLTEVTLSPYATHVFRPKDLVTDGTGTFRGSVKITETSGRQIAGAIKYEIHSGTAATTSIQAITIYRSMGQ